MSLQGSYNHVRGFVHQSPDSLAVVGSVHGYDKDVITGKAFSCANLYHKKPCVTIPVNMNFFHREDSLHINQVVPCTSKSKLFFIPSVASPSVNVLPNAIHKLCSFVVVLNSWVDYENRTVVFPRVLNLKVPVTDLGLRSPSKTIYEMTSDDWIYYIPYKNVHIADMHNWVEYSFSLAAGPLVSFRDAIGLRDFLTHCFANYDEVRQILSSSSTSTQHCVGNVERLKLTKNLKKFVLKFMSTK
jgi:hypothetical protein